MTASRQWSPGPGPDRPAHGRRNRSWVSWQQGPPVGRPPRVAVIAEGEAAVILGAEIGLLVFAIITLVRGRLVLTKNRVVTGVPARLLAIIGLVPLPLSLVLGLALGMVLVARGQPVDQMHMTLMGAGIELSVLIFCCVAIYGIG